MRRQRALVPRCRHDVIRQFVGQQKAQRGTKAIVVQNTRINIAGEERFPLYKCSGFFIEFDPDIVWHMVSPWYLLVMQVPMLGSDTVAGA